MTYNTPELLLVGAAQNLVLETSPIVGSPKVPDLDCNQIDEDATGDDYQPTSIW